MSRSQAVPSPLPCPSPPQTLGLVGYGAFGRFIAPYLAAYFDVLVYDPRGGPETPSGEGHSVSRIRAATIETVAACDIVVLAPPVQAFASVLDAIGPHLRPGTLVADVASVKLGPVALMRERLPAWVDIVGLHPLFGPQSGRHGIKGLPIVVCPVRPADPAHVIEFLATRLELTVSVQTPDEHDRGMAHVQALTHFVAAALSRMALPETNVATPSYAHLQSFVQMVRFDSPTLYQAIQLENPYAKAVRDRFVQTIAELAREQNTDMG